MARFSRIPETNLAGTLGGIAGQLAGTVIGNVKSTAENKIQPKLDELCSKFSDGSMLSEQDLQKAEKEIEQLDTLITTLNGTITTVEATVQSLSSALAVMKPITTTLKVAANITKLMPLPQIYLVTSVTTIFSDLIEMLLELVSWIEQILLTLDSVVAIILKLLKKLKDLLAKLQKILAALKASLAILLTLKSKPGMSDHDKGVLEDLGILDPNGNTIFDKLAPAINGRTTDIIWMGEYSDIDTGSLAVENKVKSAESGTTIDVPTGTVGDWITTVYMVSEIKPSKPVGRELIPAGWSGSLPQDTPGWSSRGKVSGMTEKVLFWTEPVWKLKSEDQTTITPHTRKVNVYKQLNLSDLDMKKANAIVLSSSDEAFAATLGLLQSIDNSSISSDLKSKFTVEINPQEDQSDPDSTEDWYISKLGDRYKLTLKASTVSPKIATLRYVEVTDESGTIVYEGGQTFATDPKVLFEETKVRLNQLLG